jgi:hypothetical protein
MNPNRLMLTKLDGRGQAWFHTTKKYEYAITKKWENKDRSAGCQNQPLLAAQYRQFSPAFQRNAKSGGHHHASTPADIGKLPVSSGNQLKLVMGLEAGVATIGAEGVWTS